MSVELSSILQPLRTGLYLDGKSDDRTRRITDFADAVGTEFVLLTGDPADFSMDTTHTKHGAQSVKVTAQASTSKIFSTGDIKSRKLSNCVSCRFTVYIEDAANVSAVHVYGETGAGTDGYHVSVPGIKTGWNEFSFNRSEWEIIGSPTGWDNIIRWRFRVNSTSVGAANVSFDCLDFYNPQNAKSIVLLTFDDNMQSAYSIAAPKLESYGYHGSFYINPNTVGLANYMTLSQIKELQDRGHEIGCHGYDHVDYSTITASAIRADIDKCIDWFLSNGLTLPKTMALPGGAYLNPYKESAVAERFVLARGTANMPNYVPNDSMPFGRPYNMRATGMSNGSVVVNQRIDKVASTRGITCLYAHDINQVGGSPAVTEAEFNAIVDHVASVDAEVITLSGLFSKYPQVAW